jgi:hypothetical protein
MWRWLGDGTELEVSDFRRVKLAAIGRKDHSGFSDDGGREADAVISTLTASPHIAHRVNLEGSCVIELIPVVDPTCGKAVSVRFNAFAFGHPIEGNGQFIIRRHFGGLDFAAVKIAFATVLNFDLTTNIGGEELSCQLRGRYVGMSSFVFLLGNTSKEVCHSQKNSIFQALLAMTVTLDLQGTFILITYITRVVNSVAKARIIRYARLGRCLASEKLPIILESRPYHL